jgi:hypothetical protein
VRWIVAALVGALSLGGCASDDFFVASDASPGDASPEAAVGDAGSPDAAPDAEPVTDAFCVTNFPSAAFCMDFEDGLRTAHEGKLTVSIPPPTVVSPATLGLSGPPHVRSGLGALAVGAPGMGVASAGVRAELSKPSTTPAGFARAHMRFALRIDDYTPGSSGVHIARLYLPAAEGTVIAEVNLTNAGKASLYLGAAGGGNQEGSTSLPVLGKFVAVDVDVALSNPIVASLRFDVVPVVTLSAPRTITSPTAEFTLGLDAPGDAPVHVVVDNFVLETQ